MCSALETWISTQIGRSHLNVDILEHSDGIQICLLRPKSIIAARMIIGTFDGAPFLGMQTRDHEALMSIAFDRAVIKMARANPNLTAGPTSPHLELQAIPVRVTAIEQELRAYRRENKTVPQELTIRRPEFDHGLCLRLQTLPFRRLSSATLRNRPTLHIRRIQVTEQGATLISKMPTHQMPLFNELPAPKALANQT